MPTHIDLGGHVFLSVIFAQTPSTVTHRMPRAATRRDYKAQDSGAYFHSGRGVKILLLMMTRCLSYAHVFDSA